MKVNFNVYFRNNLMICADSIQLNIGGTIYGIWSFHNYYSRFNSNNWYNLLNSTFIHIYIKVMISQLSPANRL